MSFICFLCKRPRKAITCFPPPSDTPRRRLWMSILKLDFEPQVPSYICQMHFRSYAFTEAMRLNPTCTPMYRNADDSALNLGDIGLMLSDGQWTNSEHLVNMAMEVDKDAMYAAWSQRELNTLRPPNRMFEPLDTIARVEAEMLDRPVTYHDIVPHRGELQDIADEKINLNCLSAELYGWRVYRRFTGKTESHVNPALFSSQRPLLHRPRGPLYAQFDYNNEKFLTIKAYCKKQSIITMNQQRPFTIKPRDIPNLFARRSESLWPMTWFEFAFFIPLQYHEFITQNIPLDNPNLASEMENQPVRAAPPPPQKDQGRLWQRGRHNPPPAFNANDEGKISASPPPGFAPIAPPGAEMPQAGQPNLPNMRFPSKSPPPVPLTSPPQLTDDEDQFSEWELELSQIYFDNMERDALGSGDDDLPPPPGFEARQIDAENRPPPTEEELLDAIVTAAVDNVLQASLNEEDEAALPPPPVPPVLPAVDGRTTPERAGIPPLDLAAAATPDSDGTPPNSARRLLGAMDLNQSDEAPTAAASDAEAPPTAEENDSSAHSTPKSTPRTTPVTTPRSQTASGQ